MEAEPVGQRGQLVGIGAVLLVDLDTVAPHRHAGALRPGVPPHGRVTTPTGAEAVGLAHRSQEASAWPG